MGPGLEPELSDPSVHVTPAHLPLTLEIVRASCVALTSEAPFALGVPCPALLIHGQGSVTEGIKGGRPATGRSENAGLFSLEKELLEACRAGKEQTPPSPRRRKAGPFGTDESSCSLVLLATVEYEEPDLPSYPKQLKTWGKYMKLKKKIPLKKVVRSACSAVTRELSWRQSLFFHLQRSPYVSSPVATRTV